MLPLFLMLLAANPASAVTVESDIKIAGPEKVRPSDIDLPLGDSLRAVTWENLVQKPTAPRHVALACLVMANEGTPISCVPATPKLKASNVAEWNALFDAYNAAAATTPAGERSLTDIATLRVLNTRLRPERGGKGKTSWKLMIFDEVLAPSDERPRPAPGEALMMGAVTLQKNFNPAVLRRLYPLIAQRYGMAARVAITCHIQPTLTLLCREPGKIDAEQGQPPANAEVVYTALVFASYQAASTIRLAPKAKDGRDVAGKDLTLAIRWALPPGETPAVPAAALPAPRAEGR
jgi:hypothetical protein